MLFINQRIGHVSSLVLLLVLGAGTEVQASPFNYDDYAPTLSNAAYDLDFTPASDGSGDIIVYEEKNGVWEETYYDYSYQIKTCPGNNCSSNNRIYLNKAGAEVNEPFYGLANSAIDNTNHNIGKISGDFIKNRSSRGGAINNRENNGAIAQIGDIKGDFINNQADIYGGAVYNSADYSGLPVSTAIIGNINGNFIANTAGIYGGAIYNSSNEYSKLSQIGNITGDFVANHSEYWGGAIYNNGNIGNITGNFIGNSSEDGGAFMNTRIMGDVTGDFIGNKAAGYGGAIYLANYAQIGPIKGNFVGNTSEKSGGAIFNSSAKDFKVSGDFVKNKAKYGGAIFNISVPGDVLPATSTITNSSFIDNTAQKQGGAIYHEGEMDIVADNYASVFKGNTAAGVSNALYIAPYGDEHTSTVNLIAENGGSLTFYDDITGEEGYKLNLNGDAGSRIEFHADISNGDIAIGSPAISRAVSETPSISFDNIDNIAGRNNSLIMNNGSVTFDDFALIPHHFRELRLTGGEININNADVDLVNTQMGRFVADNYTGGDASVKVHHVNVISDGDTFTAVDFADTSFAGQVENQVSAATGPVYNYAVDYLPDTGQYTFQRDSVNPEVQVSAYTAIAAAAVLSDEIYSRVLSDADSYFNADTTQDEVKPFVKVFSADDDLDLKNISGGKSKFYGVIAGAETTPQVSASGWKSVYNAYLAYARGDHKFAWQKINQESGYIGASGIFYKDSFFIGSTINAAIMENKNKETIDKNKFTSRLAGIGLKSGYDIELGSDYTLQPNIYGSYTYIHSNDYKTHRQAEVKFSDMSNMELAPGVKLSKKFEEDLEVYVKGRYVFVFNEGQDVRANGIELADVELKNYAEIGLGLSKLWPEKDAILSLEVNRREGGRDGWNSLISAKWEW